MAGEDLSACTLVDPLARLQRQLDMRTQHRRQPLHMVMYCPWLHRTTELFTV